MQFEYNKYPSNEILCKLRQARKEAKSCANDYWVELSQHIENASATGNIEQCMRVLKLQQAPLRPNLSL